MNAKEARRLSIKSKPAADAARKQSIIDWAIRTAKEAKEKRLAREAAFILRYQRVEEGIEAACKKGETKCDVRTQYEDRHFVGDILKKLIDDEYKAELAKRGYWDQGSNSEGYPDGDKFWHEYEVIAVSW